MLERIEGWHVALIALLFTLFIATVSSIGSYLASRVGINKDLQSQEKRLNGHKVQIAERVEEKMCDERSGGLKKDIHRVEATIINNSQQLRTDFGKLDEKFDKFILNNRG